jgi:hypothetical protein
LQEWAERLSGFDFRTVPPETHLIVSVPGSHPLPTQRKPYRRDCPRLYGLMLLDAILQSTGMRRLTKAAQAGFQPGDFRVEASVSSLGKLNGRTGKNLYFSRRSTVHGDSA